MLEDFVEGRLDEKRFAELMGEGLGAAIVGQAILVPLINSFPRRRADIWMLKQRLRIAMNIRFKQSARLSSETFKTATLNGMSILTFIDR